MNIPLALGASIYHFGISSSSVFRLVHVSGKTILPVVGPSVDKFIPSSLNPRLVVSLIGIALHLALGAWFISWTVETIDEYYKKQN